MNSKNFKRSQKLVDLCQHKSLSNDEPNQSERLKTRNRSAVLICLFEEGDDIYVILTKLSSYSGQVSLPGGRTDDGDTDDIHTALSRGESQALFRSGLNLISYKIENVTVVPVLDILWNKKAFNPVPNIEEVESIFYAPFEMFLKNENRRHEEKEFRGYKYLLHYFDHKTNNTMYVIWALTAGILIEAASLVYQRPPDFQPRMPKFWKKIHSRL